MEKGTGRLRVAGVSSLLSISPRRREDDTYVVESVEAMLVLLVGVLEVWRVGVTPCCLLSADDRGVVVEGTGSASECLISVLVVGERTVGV